MSSLYNKISVSILITLASSACAPEHPSVLKKEYIDPSLIEYIEKFEQMYGGEVGGIKIIFAEQESPVIGMCKVWSNGSSKRKQIEVDPYYWNHEDTSEEEKIGLIYHELGHCFLDRPHTEDKFTHVLPEYSVGVRVPSSLMYPYNFYSNRYKDLESYYFTELIFPETKKVE